MSNTNIEEPSINLEEKYKDIYNIFKEKGCTLTYFIKKTLKLKFICACGIEKERLYKDFMRGKECRTCREKKFKEIPSESIELPSKSIELPSKSIELSSKSIEIPYKPIEIPFESLELSSKSIEIPFESIEIWKPIEGGWISNFGNAKNVLDKILTLCPTKFRYHIGGKHQYASRLVAKTFEIENYDKFENNQNYIVTHIDNDSKNNKVENLKVITKVELGSINGKKARQSDTFKEKINWTKDHFKSEDVKTKVILELPKYIIYNNGEIHGEFHFLTFTKNDNYLKILANNKTYKVHRIICYAFNPIEGKENLCDYDELQVNHKDGNTLNNSSENLEWVTPSENMKHAYNTKLNNKVRNVLQYTLDGEFIQEFKSIAQASRESSEPEHRIRETAKGKKNSKAQFIWKFKNESESAEYSEKYKSK